MDYDEIKELENYINRVNEVTQYISYQDKSIPKKLKKLNKKINKDGIKSILKGDIDDE